MRHLLLICSLLSSVWALSQHNTAFTNVGRGASTTFARDYQSLGINPSNLGWTFREDSFKYHIGTSEMSFSLYSEFFSKDELISNFAELDLSNSSRQEKLELAQKFAESSFDLNIDATLFGGAFTNENFGGIALKVNSKTNYKAKLGEGITDLLFLGNTSFYFDSLALNDGTVIANSPNLSEETLENVMAGIASLGNAQNLSEILEGTNIGFSITTEIQLGYGRKLFENDKLSLYAGASGKYIMGHNYFGISTENGNTEVRAAYSPALDIDFGDVTANNPTALPSGVSQWKPVGEGFGFDFGVTAIIGKGIRVGASVTDIGSMTWNGNLYKLNDALLQELDQNSLESASVVQQFTDLTDSEGILSWESDEANTTELASTFRAGASFDLGKFLTLGLDVVSPLNDAIVNIEEPILGLGVDMNISKKFRLNAGIVKDENGFTNVPLGFVFHTKGYECGIASRDLFTYFTQDSPLLSLSFGFIRSRF